ncbi:RNI-like protein [Gigaspora margarita]|uniref:RNI-like protein n=1 Tax=Gigaspora margarita TaxID=4874 RepID=A0A8H4AES6_GIGMA|nr:RNI-like protein [Gigaspora margarita]
MSFKKFFFKRRYIKEDFSNSHLFSKEVNSSDILVIYLYRNKFRSRIKFFELLPIFEIKLIRLRELRTLNISKTKVTMNGLRTLFAGCTFASSLEVLNLSYCPGVEGKVDIQLLQNLRRPI